MGKKHENALEELEGFGFLKSIRQVQTVRLSFLHQCIKNECPPAAVLSLGVRAASSSSSNHFNQRSAQLSDEYSNAHTDNLQRTDLGNHTVEFAQDPLGSMFIKQKLEHASPTEKAQLVDALRGHVLTLALHKCGCHVMRAALKSKLKQKFSKM
uniref:PUM-HD domain-containing protein n=1 Tax=Globodera pallida TaxID=36090 RepID=A0A183CDQ4_GLOPA